jgi:hypothetical protein
VQAALEKLLVLEKQTRQVSSLTLKEALFVIVTHGLKLERWKERQKEGLGGYMGEWDFSCEGREGF